MSPGLKEMQCERSVVEHPELGVKPVVRSQRRPIVNQGYSITIPSLAYWKDDVISHCFSPMKIVNYRDTLDISGTQRELCTGGECSVW